MKAPDKHIIDKTLDNTATPEEARQVIRWFSTQEGNSYLSSLIDNDLDKIQPGSEELYVEHPIPSGEMAHYITNRIHWQRRKRLLFRVAAILIPFILLIGQFWYIDKKIDLFDNSGYEEIYVPKGERLQVIFQDGSKATLNAESRIKYPRKFGFSERKIELDGEAFFEVSPNKERPFIIDLKNIYVKVTGTSFNITAYQTEQDISVALESGKVSLLHSQQSASPAIADLKPGEKAIYNRESGLCKIIRSENITANSAWKNNIIMFNNTSLSEVIKTLSRKYNADFEIADSSAIQYSFTLTSVPKDIWDILYDLEKISPVRFEKRDKIWIIKTRK